MNMLRTIRLISLSGASLMAFSVNIIASEAACSEIRFAHSAIIPGEGVVFDLHFTNATPREIELPATMEAGLRAAALEVRVMGPDGKPLPKVSVDRDFRDKNPSDYTWVKPGEQLVLRGFDTDMMLFYKPVQTGAYAVSVRACAVCITGQVSVVAVSEDNIKKSVSIALPSAGWVDAGDRACVDLIVIQGRAWLFYRMLHLGVHPDFAVRIAEVAQDCEFIVSSDTKFVEVAYVKSPGLIRKVRLEIVDGSEEPNAERR